jgi:hypothetical protein
LPRNSKANCEAICYRYGGEIHSKFQAHVFPLLAAQRAALITTNPPGYNCIRMKEYGKVLRLVLLCLGLALSVLGRGMFFLNRDQAKGVMVMAVLSEEEEAPPQVSFVERRFMAVAPANMPDFRQGSRLSLSGFIAVLLFFIYRDMVSFVFSRIYFCAGRFFRAPVLACFLGGRGPPFLALVLNKMFSFITIKRQLLPD